MINLANNTTVVADNKVTFCGLEYFVTDIEAKKLQSIILGMINSRTNSEVVSQPVESKTPVAVTKAEKTPYVATKDFKAQYEIKKQVSNDGKELFCISRKNGWTKAEKACMNNAIKALDKIITIDVSYDKDGKTRSFKAWGYKTKKQAETMLATLPTVFTVEQLNSAL